jgi:hypothetical protein
MKKVRMKNLLGCISLFAIAGCAPMTPAPTSEIEKLPIVKVGETAPSSGEYVVYFPANSPVPVNIRTMGSLFKDEQTTKGSVTLAKDLYLYKYWASHDRKHWENSHRLLDVSFGGGFDVSGLNAVIKLEKK